MVRALFLIELRSAAVFQGILAVPILLGGWAFEKGLTVRGIAPSDAAAGVDILIGALLLVVAYASGARVNGMDRQSRQAFLARLPLGRAGVWTITAAAEAIAAGALVVVIAIVRPGVVVPTELLQSAHVPLAALIWLVLFGGGAMWSQVLSRPLLAHLVGFPLTVAAFLAGVAPVAVADSWEAFVVLVEPSLARYLPAAIVLVTVQLIASLWMHVRRDPGRSLSLVKNASVASVAPVLGLLFLLTGVADRSVGWGFSAGSVEPSPDGSLIAIEEELRDLRIAVRVRILDTRTAEEVATYRFPIGEFYARYRWSDDGRSLEFVTHRGLMGVIEAGAFVQVVRPVAGQVTQAHPREEGWLLTVAEDPTLSLVAADARTGTTRELLRLRASDPRDRGLHPALFPIGPHPGAFLFVVEGWQTETIEGAWSVRASDAEPIPYERPVWGLGCYWYRDRCYGSPNAAGLAIVGEANAPKDDGWYTLAGNWVTDEGDGLYHVAPSPDRKHEGVLRAWIGEEKRWSVIHDRVVLRDGGVVLREFPISSRSESADAPPLPVSRLDFWHTSVGPDDLLYARRSTDDRIEVAWYGRESGRNDTVAVFDRDVPEGAADPAAFLGSARIVQPDAAGPSWIQLDLREPSRSFWWPSSSVLFRVDPTADRVDRFDSLPPIQNVRMAGVYRGRVLLVATSRDSGSSRPWRWLDTEPIPRSGP